MGGGQVTGPGAVIWITGMSGAGKSSVAAELLPRLVDRGVHPVLLDGDELRAALGLDGHFGHDSRHRLAFVYARLCAMVARQGHIVVCSTIALFHDVQAWNRANLADYFEVFLDVPAGELQARNSKGLYDVGLRHVVGVDMPAEFPIEPDLRISNYGATTPAAAARRIVRLCEMRGVCPG